MTADHPQVDTEKLPREDVVSSWREEGFTEDFEIVKGGAIDCGGDETHPAGAYTVEHQFRYEGITNPGDEEVLLAATAPCGRKGTLTMAYGPTASADEAEVARALAAS